MRSRRTSRGRSRSRNGRVGEGQRPVHPRPVCTINGTSRNDVLTGSSRDDIICGYGGNDRIDGRGGADIIIAGPGKDVISARDHVIDRVDGGPGNDKGTFDRSPRDRVSGVEHPSFG